MSNRPHPLPEVSLDLVPGDGAVLRDLSSGGVGRLDVRKVLCRLGKPLQVIRVDHRGHAAAPAGQERPARVWRGRRRRSHRDGYAQLRQAGRA